MSATSGEQAVEQTISYLYSHVTVPRLSPRRRCDNLVCPREKSNSNGGAILPNIFQRAIPDAYRSVRKEVLSPDNESQPTKRNILSLGGGGDGGRCRCKRKNSKVMVLLDGLNLLLTARQYFPSHI